MNPYFTLSKSKLLAQLKILTDLNLSISYSYKTNREIGNLIQELSPQTKISIHAQQEIEMISDKSRIIFFTQAESIEQLEKIIQTKIKNFVVDNEIDLTNLLEAAKNLQKKISISLRMKFQEHRIGTGKYFVYGMPSSKINKLIQQLENHENISSLGVHVHRKSQNTSEWEITEELKDSLEQKTLEIIGSVNLGGGLPVAYKSYTTSTLPYILKKIANCKTFLDTYNIETIIEPGRFIAAPPIKLHTSIIQVQNNNLIINTTLYNCSLDTIITETKMLVEQEIGNQQATDKQPTSAKQQAENPKDFLIKGNSPSSDDIFRYKVKLNPEPKVGDKITFLNAGAYNYTTDFFGYKKLETKIIE